jgi:hypothetical protein
MQLGKHFGRSANIPGTSSGQTIFSYLNVPHRLLQGASQVTDAWLAELARQRKGKLATFDQALVALHRDVAELVPSIPE